MAKSNYRQLKKQREQSKKARQAEKQQKRSVRPGTAMEDLTAAASTGESPASNIDGSTAATAE